MATTALGYAAAFTTTQWKELERQAMIYKYMVASVPVPPHLLLPLTLSSSSPPDSSSDPEVGRCKRTDGKKWRCSRDVAPHHKYCERHMHRGRPRSRKPVELSPNTTTTTTTTTNKKTRLHLSPPTVSTAAPPPSPRLLGSANASRIEDTSLSLYSIRGLDLMMTKDASEQQWNHYMNGGLSMYTTTTSPSIFQQNYKEEQQLSLLSFPGTGNSYNDELIAFLNPYDQAPRDFIDAWSNDNNPKADNNNDSVASANGTFSPSLDLSMAMAVGNSLDDEIGEIQMGEEAREITDQRCQSLSWLSPVSWIDSEPGGPLAEVLRPSNVTVNSDPGYPYAGKNGERDAVSPPPVTSASSSPSGVLHRTMLSLSDTSVCNSPTLAATSTMAPEVVGFQCLN